MATVAATPSVQLDTIPERPNALWQFTKSQPLGLFGFLIILLYVVCAFGAGWISPFDPEAIDFSAMLSKPGGEHWFGTDQYGRDVFSRIVYGSRTALAVGIISAVAGCTLGALVGAASGYFGGRIDNAIQRVVDIINREGFFGEEADVIAAVINGEMADSNQSPISDGDHVELIVALAGG